MSQHAQGINQHCPAVLKPFNIHFYNTDFFGPVDSMRVILRAIERPVFVGW